jgi:tRNA(Ile)-lysidine synthase
MSAREADPVSVAEARTLFTDLTEVSALILAVSGGPDSTALMLLGARWRDSLKRKAPNLIAVTVDHGLRPEAKKEAKAVAALAARLGIAHRTLRWTGKKSATGLQQAARAARYALLAKAAREAGATHVLTAHTRDDQAETVLIRLSRGSGLTGLAAMSRIAPVPGEAGVTLLRPLLDFPKARLVATLRAAGIAFADDPSNADPRFTRARLRGLMPALAAEGLDAVRLAQLSRRLRRAEAAIEAAVAEAEARLTPASGTAGYAAAGFAALPDEVGLRLLGRAIGRVGDEGPVELGKLEALKSALDAFLAAKSGPAARFRRTLAGAIVTLAKGRITVERAPRRRTLTKRRPGKAGARKTR